MRVVRRGGTWGVATAADRLSLPHSYTLLVGKPPFQTKDVKNIYRCAASPPLAQSLHLQLILCPSHSKIKDNNYVFPPEIELSVEAVDLISIILNTAPEQRPTLAQILEHDFFTSGPFPASISPSSLNNTPDYRHMSIRAAHRNFKAVKMQCGIVEPVEGAAVAPAPAAVVQPPRAPLQSVNEEAEEEGVERRTASRREAVTVAAPTVQAVTTSASSKEARGMEMEVQQVLAPESPISELLRCASTDFSRSAFGVG